MKIILFSKINPNPSEGSKSTIKETIRRVLPILKGKILNSLNAVGGAHGLNIDAIEELFETSLFKKGQVIWELGFGTGLLALYAGFHTTAKVIATDTNSETFDQIVSRIKSRQKDFGNLEPILQINQSTSRKRGVADAQITQHDNKKRTVINDDED